MATSYDPFADLGPSFSAAPAPPAPAPTPANIPVQAMQNAPVPAPAPAPVMNTYHYQQQAMMTQNNSGSNPFEALGQSSRSHMTYGAQSQPSAMVATAVPPNNQWALQNSAQSIGAYNPSPYAGQGVYGHQQQIPPSHMYTQQQHIPHQGIGLSSNSSQSPSQNSAPVLPYGQTQPQQLMPTQHASIPQMQPHVLQQQTPHSRVPTPASSNRTLQTQSQIPAPLVTHQQTHQVQPQPTQPPAAIVEEDNDFFGDFASQEKKKEPEKMPPRISTGSPGRPSSFILSTDAHDDVSNLSRSTNGTSFREKTPRNSSRLSPLDDPKFAPKPPPVRGLQQARALSGQKSTNGSPLPDFDLVSHSGFCLARISFRTILIKKWKQVFWVTYGTNQILIFRSTADFADWVSNPYLSQLQRDFLVKLKIDLVDDLYKPNVRGYQVTNQRLKNYNNQMLHQFKIERWMDYGPTIAAAFASSNEREVFNLRTIFVESIKRHAKNKSLNRSGAMSQNAFGRSDIRTPDTHHARHYRSAASTGHLERQRTTTSRDSHMSNDIMSSGPMERNQYVAGYRVSTRQY